MVGYVIHASQADRAERVTGVRAMRSIDVVYA